MDITKLALEKSRITFTVLTVLMFAGIMTYLNMPRSEDPGFIVRTALVETVFPGASPGRVEQLVTDKLEKVIQQIPELKDVRSTSKTGLSVIYVDILGEYKKMRPIWDKLRRKINSVKPELPAEVQGPFVNDEFGDVFGTVYTLTGDGIDYRDLKQIAKEVRSELLLQDEVGKVNILGSQDQRIYLDYDNARLAQYGLSPVTLRSILEQTNIVLPGGSVTLPYEKIVMDPSGNFNSVEDIRRTVINIPGNKDVVHLEDLVDIKHGYIDPPEAVFHASGEKGLALAVSLRKGGNIIALGEQVKAVFSRAETVYPVGVEFKPLLFQSKVVADKVNNFALNLVESIGVVMLVVMIFLGLRTGLIVSSLIPVTMVITIFAMSLFNEDLNQMTLASLIIALGMLVDNAIVMSETIMNRMQQGLEPKQAAIDSAAELKIPLLTSSLTTSAAFLPIFLAKSATGEYTSPLFVVVTITLLVSWMVSLTMIPMLCVLFMKVKTVQKNEEEEFNSKGQRFYRSVLLSVVRFPVISLAAVVAIFMVSLQGFNYIPSIFFPDNDRPVFTVELNLPEGSPIQYTEQVVTELEEFLHKNLRAQTSKPNGVTSWGAFIGEGAPKFNLSYNPKASSANYAILVGNATDAETIQKEIVPQVQQHVIEKFPGVLVTAKLLPLGDAPDHPVAIRISGPDTDELFHISEQVKAQLGSLAGPRSIRNDWGTRIKKVGIDVNEVAARLAGVTNQDIAASAQAYLSGFNTTIYRDGDELIPITLRARQAQRLDPAAIGNLSVFSEANGQSVPLSQVATPTIEWQYGEIARRDRMRTVTVQAELVPGYTAVSVTDAMTPWLEEQAKQWPFGFRWEFGGEYETNEIAQNSIAVQLPVAGLIIVLLLVGQFNSIRRASIILLTIPLSIIGVVIGLLLMKLSFGFMSLLGVISLAGIVINNAIVLIDRIRIEIEENGRTPQDAVIMSAQQRLRPIVLTTLTTIGGMLTLVGGGPLWQSMAITIIFGIMFATVLTLGVVPTLYALIFRVKFGKSARKTKTDAADLPGLVPETGAR